MASGSYSTGTWTSRTNTLGIDRNSWYKGGFNKRHNFNFLSDDHLNEIAIDPSECRIDPNESRIVQSESTSDPFDLDTAMLYLNVTTLQHSCKKLSILKKKLEKKSKKKEEKKNSHQKDSNYFKKKKEAYREVYDEILVEMAAVESIFHKSGRSTNDNQTRRQTASERQNPKSRPHLPQMDTEECEKCQQNENNIWKLKNDIDRSRSDARDLQHKIAALETQIALETSDKEDALRRLSSMASAKPRYKNPNIDEQLSDPNRPTKIAEKLSEIYDNEWTDAFDHLEINYGKNEEQNVQLLLNVLIEVYQQCNNQYEDIVSKITAPLKPQDIPPEVGNDLKNAVKRFAQFKMPAVAKEIKSNLPRRFVNAAHLFQHPGDAFDIYIDKCIDACLHMSVQDPPMYLSADPNKDGLFSNALYKTFTKSGKYEVFIVWPVLYLHRNGQIMTKGVAQGTDDNIMIKNNSKQSYQQSAPSHYVARRQHDYDHRQHHQHEQDQNEYSGMKTSTDEIFRSRNDARELQHKINALETQIAKERSDKEDALRRLSSMASAKLRYNNPNKADLSDPNRPTKIAEKLSEIYDNEWTDAFDHLEMTHSKIEEENVQLLLNVLIEVYQQCNNQCEDILSKITAPLKPQDIPPEVGNDLKNAVKRLAQFKMTAVAQEIKSNLPRRFVNAGHLFQHSGDAFDIYIDKCIDACLHMSVQDPPMYLSADPNKDGLFSNALYKAYTKSGKYEVFIVWPVLYLHRNGQIMTKGIAQGTDDNIMIKNNSNRNYQQSAPSHYVARRQHDYKHGQQHQQEQYLNQNRGMQTSYGLPTNNRVPEHPSHYRGQGYSNNQFSKTYHPSYPEPLQFYQ